VTVATLLEKLNAGRNNAPREGISTEHQKWQGIGMFLRMKIAGLFVVGPLLFGTAAYADPTGSSAETANASPLLVWTKLQSELERERQVISNCRNDFESCESPAARRFIAIVDEGARYEDKARIAHINRAANLAIRSTTKPTQDWTSPLVALAAGAGDCKQFAILKYAALMDSGFRAEHLRILIVEDKPRRATHAVVAVRAGTQWLVLNNRTSTLVEFDEFLGRQALLWTLDQPASAEFSSQLTGRPGS
jgi:predicted transglutaminase-like cysteine proteinase